MTPDYQAAAMKATETIIEHKISAAPVVPMPILKSMRGVLVLSYEEMARHVGVDRSNAVLAFGASNQDASTTVSEINGKLRYVVVYNQRLSFYLLQRALARELGHIVLGHDGSRPESVRQEEALCFARYLLCPRPVIHAIQEAGICLTNEMIGNITGCYERCMRDIRKTPGVHIPAELNRRVREQFSDYIASFIDYQSFVAVEDESAPADFGTFMDNYDE